jgi:hypothetical protein
MTAIAKVANSDHSRELLRIFKGRFKATGLPVDTFLCGPLRATRAADLLKCDLPRAEVQL